MARNKMTLVFDELEEYMHKLEKIGGEELIKKATNEALIKSKEYADNKISKAISKSSLPAGGKYSVGKLKQSMINDNKVTWLALEGSVDVGFDMNISGTESIFLMYGTPRMKPAKGLKSAIYGKTKKLKELQREIIGNYIERTMS